MTHFLNFAPIISLELVKLGTSNFVIDTEEYECMHDILFQKGMRSESHDLFRFWEISDKISEMGQDRDIVAM